VIKPANFRPFSDAPESIGEVIDRFRASLVDSEGEAAIEIGVRAGGTSAAMCAAAAKQPGFLVIGLDPWGNAPYTEGGVDVSSRLDYGEDHYATARQLLAPFPNSALFRIDADTFLEALLPRYRWWVAGRSFPTVPRWLAFAYLDGLHDDADVAREALLLLPFLAPGGRICVDDVHRCPAAIALLGSIPRLVRENTSERRACFVAR
jgi:hypothetical protein